MPQYGRIRNTDMRYTATDWYSVETPTDANMSVHWGSGQS